MCKMGSTKVDANATLQLGYELELKLLKDLIKSVALKNYQIKLSNFLSLYINM